MIDNGVFTMQWQAGLAVFVGTLPLTGAIVWNLLDNKRRFDSIENRLGRIEARLDDLFNKFADIAQRVAILEERDRRAHLIHGD